jgi:hypothetical protein
MQGFEEETADDGRSEKEEIELPAEGTYGKQDRAGAWREVTEC